MSGTLIRHFPALAAHLQPDDNAFILWESPRKWRLHERVALEMLFPGQVLRWLSKA